MSAILLTATTRMNPPIESFSFRNGAASPSDQNQNVRKAFGAHPIDTATLRKCTPTMCGNWQCKRRWFNLSEAEEAHGVDIGREESVWISLCTLSIVFKQVILSHKKAHLSGRKNSRTACYGNEGRLASKVMVLKKEATESEDCLPTLQILLSSFVAVQSHWCENLHQGIESFSLTLGGLRTWRFQFSECSYV